MSDDRKLTILGHLTELRSRLTRCLIAVLVTTVISFVFASDIFYILMLPSGGASLIFIEMTEMLGTYVKVCITAGIILAMPYLVYELLMFVSPALTRKEKKYFYIVLPWVALTFIAGVAFGYFILIPPATIFLLSFGSEIATPQIRIGSYINVVTRLLLAIGITFELPVVSTFLARLGVISPQWLASKRKLAFVLAFALGALITPTFDPFNQSLVALPLIVLYEMSIWLARLVYRRSPRTVTFSSTNMQN